MTAEEIRGNARQLDEKFTAMPLTISALIAAAQAMSQLEIAAQLAELNQQLREQLTVTVIKP